MTTVSSDYDFYVWITFFNQNSRIRYTDNYLGMFRFYYTYNINCIVNDNSLNDKFYCLCSKTYLNEPSVDYFNMLLITNYNFDKYDGISIKFNWDSIYIYYNNLETTYIKNLPYRIDIFYNGLEVINDTPLEIFFKLYSQLSLVNLDIIGFIDNLLTRDKWYEKNIIKDDNSFKISVNEEDDMHILSDVKYIKDICLKPYTNTSYNNIVCGFKNKYLYDYKYEQRSYLCPSIDKDDLEIYI